MTTIPILFQQDGKQPVEIEFPKNCTVAGFEKIVERIYGPGPWKYHFICHGKKVSVANENELEALKALLVPKTTLFTRERTKGNFGVTFVDVRNTNNIKRMEFATTGPSWYEAYPGLCLEGICENGKCEAHNEWVIANIGLRTFNFNLEIGDFSKCPSCQEYVEPVTCGFNQCEWRCRGQIREGNKKPEKVDGDKWNEAGCAYYRFDKMNDTVNWLELIFDVRAL